MASEELERMLGEVARENGFQLYKLYGEEQAAAFIGCEISTLKKRRRAGEVPYINLGQRQVRYLGRYIAAIMLGVGDAAIPKE